MRNIPERHNVDSLFQGTAPLASLGDASDIQSSALLGALPQRNPRTGRDAPLWRPVDEARRLCHHPKEAPINLPNALWPDLAMEGKVLL